MMTKPDAFEKQRQPLSRIRLSNLHAVNSLFAVIERESGVIALYVDFSSIGCSMQLNGLYLTGDMCGMLKRKVYCAVNMVFSIVRAYVDHPKGFQTDVNILLFNACIPICCPK